MPPIDASLRAQDRLTCLERSASVIVISATAVQGTVTSTIDTFNATAQSVTDAANDGIPVTDVAAAAEAIGGERDLSVNLTSSIGAIQLQANNPISPGVLRVDTGGAATGQQIITWDGSDGSDFFLQLAAHWKSHYAGWSAWPKAWFAWFPLHGAVVM